jgi:diaminopimelate decarboxylase
MSALATPVAPRDATRHPAIEAGERIAGLDPEELLGRFGSPLFVYDLDVLTERVAMLREALPPSGELAFAVKANPSLAVLAHLARLGVGADVASGGELDAALLAGIPRRRIVFTGPGKTDAELERALRVGIRAITIESLDELDAVIELADVARGSQGLLLRLAIDGPSEEVPIIGGAGAAKFGLLPAEVDAAVDRVRRATRAGSPLDLLGLHAFGASNVLDADAWVDGIRRLADRAEELSRRHDLPIRLLDGGGGLGIPYGPREHPFDLIRSAAALADETASWARRRALSTTRLLIEPGRFLCGPIGAYVVRVVRTKPRGDRTIAVVDGGIHHLARPALIGTAPRVVACGASATRTADARVDVVGPLCTGLDVLATGVALPQPRRADVLALLDAGAYGFSESMPYFLSHAQPAEVVVRDGRASLARPRVDPGRLLSAQRQPGVT